MWENFNHYYWSNNNSKIYHGDVREVLKTFPDESIDMVITSPPYYGLRIYKTEPQIWGGDKSCQHNWILERNFCSKCKAWQGDLGLEPTFEMYLDHLLEIFAEIKRVLKKTGSFWLNMGDCYASHTFGISKKGGGLQKKIVQEAKAFPRWVNKSKFYPDKCMLMMPERLAIRMIDEQGWILRNSIIWAKQILIKKENRTIGSVMPTSVKDRFNQSYEYLFFFVKSKKYYSNLDAVRLPNQVVGITDLRPNGILRQRLYPESKYNKFNYRVRDAERKSDQCPQFKASEEEITSEIAKKYGYDPEGICPICGRTWKRHASPNVKDRKEGLRREFIPCIKRDWRQEAEKQGQLFDTPVLHQGGGNTGLKNYQSKYKSITEEAQYRQGMHRNRGQSIIEKRPYLPPQKDFVDKLRENFTIDQLVEKTSLPRTHIEHWFRYDDNGFAYPSKEDWEKIGTDLFKKELTTVIYETDVIGKYQIGKNLPTVWLIGVEPHNFSKEYNCEVDHFATFPEALIDIPIKFSCPPQRHRFRSIRGKRDGWCSSAKIR